MTSYQEAVSSGLLYYVGRPCKRHGEGALRLTSNRTCVECQRVSKKRYKKKHRVKWQESERKQYNKPMTVQRFIKRCVRSANRRAKLKNLPIDITFEYLMDIWTDYCPVFGVEFDVQKRGRGRFINRPSLDRIVPQFGYVAGNVVFISYLANTIKNSASLVEITQVTNWLERKYKETTNLYSEVMKHLPS